MSHANQSKMSSQSSVIPDLAADFKEPLIYLSAAQQHVTNPRLKRLIINTVGGLDYLPAWVPARKTGIALVFGTEGIDNAQTSLNGTPYIWATEFENVHATWAFEEPVLEIDGKTYICSEIYYQSQKPKPFDDAIWDKQKETVMYRACRAKLDAAGPEFWNILLKTHPYPLLSVKGNRVWGFNTKHGGQNLLAPIWM